MANRVPCSSAAAGPGGKITNVALNDVDVAAKRLQILKEAIPNMTRVALR